jgi:hypothetical protein
LALRMRVIISAIESVICMASNLLCCVLPACFPHAGDISLVSQVAETDAAYSEFAKIGVRPAADLASVVGARRILRRSFLLYLH